MPTTVSIIGNSNSGKTTLIEKLVGELKSRGYSVATIKHTDKRIPFDPPGKDSWRHLQAGSEATILSSHDKMVLIKPAAPDITLDEITQVFGEDYDIVLTEGFKQANAPKIEVHRRETGPLLSNIKKLIAIATDEPLETKTEQFSLDDIKGLANLLEQGFIKARGEQLSLYINNTAVSLKVFPKELIISILMAIASSLKGVGEAKSLKIFLKKKSKLSAK